MLRRNLVRLVGIGAAAGLILGLIGPPARAQTLEQKMDLCLDEEEEAEPEEIIEACTAGIESGQWPVRELTVVLDNRGLSYRNIRDYDRAIADFTEAIRLEPKRWSSLMNRGRTYLFHLNKYNLAIADFSAILEDNAKDAQALYARGLAKKRSGDESGGEADKQAALAIDANVVEFWFPDEQN